MDVIHVFRKLLYLRIGFYCFSFLNKQQLKPLIQKRHARACLLFYR